MKKIRVHNIKKVTYLVNHLNANRLTTSFSQYFKYKTNIPSNKDALVSNVNGKNITLIGFFRKNLLTFKQNFNYHTRTKCNLTIGRGENESGGKGKQLTQQRSREEILLRRRQKRSRKKEHGGRIFFMNEWRNNGEKYIMVRTIIISQEFHVTDYIIFNIKWM